MKAKTNIQFVSKRNSVKYDYQKDCVIKVFAKSEDYFKEKSILLELGAIQLIRAPRLLQSYDELNQIELEYVDGELLLEELERFELEEDLQKSIQLLEKLIHWLYDFYKLDLRKQVVINNSRSNITDLTEKQIVFGDVNLRNFIVSDNEIVGIDYESCRYGSPKEELHYLLAMYMMYKPIETEYKKNVVNKLCQIYQLNTEDISKDIWLIKNRRKRL